MNILSYPHPKLREVALPVVSFDATLLELALGMVEALKLHRGAGLAANQVGQLLRVVLVRPPTEQEPIVAVNPRIVSADGSQLGREGCLSLPGVTPKVRRARQVTVVYQNLEGVEREREATGLEAACWQHELDHLDGILIIDRTDQLGRDCNKRELEQLRVAWERDQRLGLIKGLEPRW